MLLQERCSHELGGSVREAAARFGGRTQYLMWAAAMVAASLGAAPALGQVVCGGNLDIAFTPLINPPDRYLPGQNITFMVTIGAASNSEDEIVTGVTVTLDCTNASCGGPCTSDRQSHL